MDSDAAKISIFLLSSKLFRTFFYLEGKITNKICTFVPCYLLVAAAMSFEEDGADGRSTTLRNKRHCTLCFWWLERRKLKPLIKDNGRGDAYGCVYRTQPECAEGLLCPHAHFWVYCIYTTWGYRICSFYREGCGRPKQQNGQQEIPSFFAL